MWRLSAIAALASLVLAACTAPGPDRVVEPASTARGGAVVLEPVTAGPREDVPSALRDGRNPALPAAQVDLDRVISGGPPPDGIPSIDEPRFEPASGVTWLGQAEPVIALSLDGEERAYPVQILMWHEIVNDTVAGRPIALTYCPLCNSALAFDRQVGERLLSFGTSGSLYLSALVMYDRQTESLWSQVERRAIHGVLSGTELELIPVSTVRWADWLAANPGGWVLSRETGFARRYGSNPYVGYDSGTGTFLDEPVDGRFPPKERVVVFPDADQPVAVLLSELAELGVAEIMLGSQDVVLFAAAGLASALDSSRIADGREIAATGAFLPTVGERRLTFEPARDQSGIVAVDMETGSGWDLLGVAVTGPMTGVRLTRISHLDTFWFAQAAFEPATEVIRLT